MKLKFSKILVVIQWDSVLGFDSYRYGYDSPIDFMAVEFSHGKVPGKDSMIYWGSELWITRRGYDAYGIECTPQKTKKTRDAAILGPIADTDKNFWYSSETEILIANQFKNYRCFILDLTKVPEGIDEIKFYLKNSLSYSRAFSLVNFKLIVIPVINELFPEIFKKSMQIDKIPLMEIKDGIELLSIKIFDDNEYEIDFPLKDKQIEEEIFLKEK